jgi:hypothetical protein
MPSLPTASDTLTDVIFIVLRHEFSKFAGHLIADFRKERTDISNWVISAPPSSKASMDEAFKELQELLETKYLRYCDPSQPLHLITMLCARAAMNNIQFLTHHPRRWASLEQTPLSEREWIFDVSVKILEQHNMLQSNLQLKRFAWHAAYNFQWHAFIHVSLNVKSPLLVEHQRSTLT